MHPGRRSQRKRARVESSPNLFLFGKCLIFQISKPWKLQTRFKDNLNISKVAIPSIVSKTALSGPWISQIALGLRPVLEGLAGQWVESAQSQNIWTNLVVYMFFWMPYCYFPWVAITCHKNRKTHSPFNPSQKHFIIHPSLLLFRRSSSPTCSHANVLSPEALEMMTMMTIVKTMRMRMSSPRRISMSSRHGWILQFPLVLMKLHPRWWHPWHLARHVARMCANVFRFNSSRIISLPNGSMSPCNLKIMG